MLSWRDSSVLRCLTLVGAIGALALPRVTPYALSFWDCKLAAYFKAFVMTILTTASRASELLIVADLYKPASATAELRGIRAHLSRHRGSIIAGLFLSIGLVGIFGSLFISADAAFEGLVFDFFDYDWDVIALHVFFVWLFGWIAAGYLLGLNHDNDGESVMARGSFSQHWPWAYWATSCCARRRGHSTLRSG